MIHSVIKANKKYYPQTLLEESKYIQEKMGTKNYIDEELEKMNQIATPMMRQDLILILMNNLLKIF